MKVSRLQAAAVHGYLQFDVEFAEDLTFLTGLNGSGKTSALRLLMGLLTPNLSELGAIAFEEAAVTVSDAGRRLVIRAVRRSDRDGIEISASGVSESLSLSSADLQLLTEVAKPDEPRQPVQEKVAAHPVFQAIRDISTPMFLGLDRRFFANAPFGEDWSERRRRELMLRRHWEETPTRGAATASLAETNYLVMSRMQEIRAAQEELDDNLRGKILARAFEYKPSDISNTGQAPSRHELDRYRERLSHIERAAEDLRLPVPELKNTLTEFFERMNRVVNSLEQGDKNKRKPDFEKDIRACQKFCVRAG